MENESKLTAAPSRHPTSARSQSLVSVFYVLLHKTYIATGVRRDSLKQEN